MQKTIILILAVTTVGLGVTLLVLWKKVATFEERTHSAELALEMEKGTRATHEARARDLERVNKALGEKVQQFAEVTTTLRATEAKQSSNLTAMAQIVKSTGAKPPGSESEEGL